MRQVVLGAAVVLLAASTAAQETLVFRAGAQTVSIYATVRDRDGHLVPGLTKADFQVFDDGKPADVTTFSNDVLPASIALLLDMSTSMIGEQLRVRDSALHFIDGLLPEDKVRIGTFGDEVALSPWLTSDKAILSRVLREEVWPGGDTPLWSAMRAAMSSLADEASRRVIVTLTDGIDTGCPRMIGGLRPAEPSGAVAKAGFFGQAPNIRGPVVLPPPQASRCAGQTDVEKLALEREFMIYAIGMEGPGLTGGLLKLADETGGGRFELKKNADLTAAFTEVADELHHQYALGVTPVALDGRVHQLDVRLSRAGMTARARKSYLAVEK